MKSRIMSKLALALSLAATLTLAAATPEIPRNAGELAVPLANGKSAKVSDYRGKVLILAFILTT